MLSEIHARFKTGDASSTVIARALPCRCEPCRGHTALGAAATSDYYCAALVASGGWALFDVAHKKTFSLEATVDRKKNAKAERARVNARRVTEIASATAPLRGNTDDAPNPNAAMVADEMAPVGVDAGAAAAGGNGGEAAAVGLSEVEFAHAYGAQDTSIVSQREGEGEFEYQYAAAGASGEGEEEEEEEAAELQEDEGGK